jgi:hypothetical protein
MGETSRRDAWWKPSLLTFLGLTAFIVYSTWAALQGEHYFYDAAGQHYLSPMYSPVLWDPPGLHSGHAWFGSAPDWLLAIWPTAILPFTPAFLILWAPGGFRFTCYYYRGAYYKAFWADPVSCAVGEPGFRGKKYRGERKLPLVLQNVHRYFLYIAILFIGILSYDAVLSYLFTTTDPQTGVKSLTFGIGLGSLVLTINPILLGGYTFGCHSLRHLVGGRFNILSRRPARKRAYDCVSCLNRRHMLWAWLSLFWVGFTDFYVRICSMGIIRDPVFVTF